MILAELPFILVGACIVNLYFLDGILMSIQGGRGSSTAYHVDAARAGSMILVIKGQKRWQAVMPGAGEGQLKKAFQEFAFSSCFVRLITVVLLFIV